MAAKKGHASVNIGFIGALQLLFIGLKLAGCIDWSWWVVFAPSFAWLCRIVLLFALLGVLAYIEKTTK